MNREQLPRDLIEAPNNCSLSPSLSRLRRFPRRVHKSSLFCAFIASADPTMRGRPHLQRRTRRNLKLLPSPVSWKLLAARVIMVRRLSALWCRKCWTLVLFTKKDGILVTFSGLNHLPVSARTYMGSIGTFATDSKSSLFCADSHSKHVRIPEIRSKATPLWFSTV